ncbi:MAG TPA: glycosyltransferase family 39 protein [Rhizomicrobium sp.]|nr:glycosyltransferase family 39 protein [Rhizomicrobium sp.]
MSDATAVPASPTPTPAAKPRFMSSQALHRLAYPLLAVLCVMLWLPGILSLPALDRDESRFAQSSRQMLDSGNFVDIRFGQVPRYKKPVGIYWMQAATTSIAGHAENLADGQDTKIWTYRLPSLIGGIGAVWLTYWLGSVFGADVGLAAALLLGFSVLTTAEATIATTDAVLLATVLGMQGVLLRIYKAAAEGAAVPARLAMWGWAAFALGILVKGPVIAGVAAATIAALLVWDWRAKTGISWTWLKATRPAWGVALTLLIVAPWLIAIWRESQGAFFQQSLGNDFAAKLAGGQESHGAPPGYNLVLSTIAFWPAILFVLPGIGLGIAKAKEPMVRFLLAWAGSWWLVCEAVPTKLPHYVLPAYPALAILTALWVLVPKGAGESLNPVWRKTLATIAILQFLVGLALLSVAPVWLPKVYGDGLATGLIAYAVVGGLIGLGALIMLLTGGRVLALSLALLSFLILAPTLTAGAGPRLTDLWLTQKLKALVVKDTQAGDPPPALAGYEEPSLVFALGTDVSLTDGRGAARLGADFGGLALVDDYEQPKFLARLAELQSDAVPVDQATGFDYSRGRKVHVTVYRVRKLIYAPPPAHWVTH